jgi:putative acetyltransferase
VIVIRPETAADCAAICDVNARAFGRDDEARLVDELRRSDAFIPELSLVAVEDGVVCGHILFSRIRIRAGDTTVPALALAPMAVHPEAQRRGIGSQLVRRGLEECRRLRHGIVVVVGHAAYYPRFGFEPARARGLEAPFPVADPSFMVRELIPGALAGVRGTVEYPPAFDAV